MTRTRTFTIGGFTSRPRAELMCSDLLSENIARTNPVLFPSPVAMGVTMKVAKAEPVRSTSMPASAMYPYRVRFTVTVRGEGDNVERYLSNLGRRAEALR